MEPGRGTLEVTCTACGAVWAAPGARFCGRCGTALPASVPDRTAAGGGPDDRRDRDRRPWDADPGGRRSLVRWAAVAVGAAIVAIVAGTAVLVGGTIAPDGPVGETTVELPDPDGVPHGAPGRPIVTTCEPVGCERWRTELPPGSLTPAGDLLLHTTIAATTPDDGRTDGTAEERPPSDGASGDPTTGDAALVLVAIDTASGEIRWRHAVPTSPGVPASPALDVGDDLVLIAAAGRLHALQRDTGARRWTVPSDGQLHAARVGEADDVLVWGRASPQPVGADGSRVQRPEIGVGSLGTLASLARDTGQLRWQRPDVELVTWSATAVLVRLGPTADQLAGIDATTGQVTWRRGHDPGGERLVVGDDAVALLSAGTLEVLDPGTGAMRHRLDVEGIGDVDVTFVGSVLALTHAEPEGGRSLRVVDPADAGEDRAHVDDVVSAHPVELHHLRAATPWDPRPTEGIAVLSQAGDRLRLQLLGHDGTVRWSQDRTLPDATCCWTLAAGPDAASVALLPPRRVLADVEVVDLDDGRTRTLVPAPAVARDETLRWVGGLAIVELPRPTVPRTTIHGAGGRVLIEGRAEVVVTDPLPVVRTADGLIGLEPAVFLGP